MKTYSKAILLTLLMFGIQWAFAQSIAYIEMTNILEKMPAFEQANLEIETQAKQWETELDNKYQGIESLYQEYVSNEASMPPDVKKQKQDAIFQAEAAAKAFKEEKFGMEGALSILQEEKLSPLYEEVTQAAEKVATESGYSYLFNKDGESNWIYTNPEHNLTEKVVSALGL